MRGNRPLALGGVLVSWFWLVVLVGFCLVLGLLVFFSPSSCCVSFPFNDDLGTPPTRRPHSWKKTRLLAMSSGTRVVLYHCYAHWGGRYYFPALYIGLVPPIWPNR